MAKVSANKAGSEKPKRKPPPHAWKPGQSGNPAGRPRAGESWSELINWAGSLTPEQVVEMVGASNDLGKSYRSMPKKVQMKVLVILRVYAALMFDPSGTMWSGLMDRADGKVQDNFKGTLELDIDDKVKKMLSLIYGGARK